MRVGEPGGAFVVEVGQRAFLELRRAVGVLGDDARITHRADPFRVRVMDVALPRAIDRAGELQHLGLRKSMLGYFSRH